MDKYLVTAGRMRAFLERWNGNIKAWAATDPAATPDLVRELPGSMATALEAVGPADKKSCKVGEHGARTYWQPPVDGDMSDFSKDVLDEKALNCVTWELAQALCMSDGMRLATSQEVAWMFENRGRPGGKTRYPWQFRDTTAYDITRPDERLAHQYSYATPNPPAGLRSVMDPDGPAPLDQAFFIAPPGRFPRSANMHGVQDAAGNMLVWVADAPLHFVWTVSWEKHDDTMVPELWNKPAGPKGYYALGARCARSL
jgi:hypothetical protein